MFSLALLVVWACTGAIAQNNFFVTPEGSGSGKSWDDACAIQTALARAVEGDEIWLKKGTYLTSSGTDRNEAFILQSNVSLYGGFEGTESKRSQRSLEPQQTVLSAEIGTNKKHDNGYTVLIIEKSALDVSIDGLTFNGGYASGAGPIADPKRAGGAVLIKSDKEQTASRVAFMNCVFQNNYARDGGAVYIDGRAAQQTLTFEKCEFVRNEADLDGGAVYCDARKNGNISPDFSKCKFTGNTANYGAVIFTQASKGKCNPELYDSHFSKNFAYVKGQSLFSVAHKGEAEPIVQNCVFDNPKGTNTDLASSKSVNK